MSIIEGAAMRCRTMADGSLRIEIEVEPRNAQAAFALFGAPGRAVALAALKDGAGAMSTKPADRQSVDQAAPSTPKGGEWAKLAGMWCNSPHFHAFLNQTYPEDTYVETSEHAAMAVRAYCGIDSRAELDSNQMALGLFNRHLRRPFMQWMKVRGVEIDQREHA